MEILDPGHLITPGYNWAYLKAFTEACIVVTLPTPTTFITIVVG